MKRAKRIAREFYLMTQGGLTFLCLEHGLYGASLILGIVGAICYGLLFPAEPETGAKP
jgi:hypothetical protein